jgi:hypothetical protein
MFPLNIVFMKKSTKKFAISLFIILTFGLSSIAYVVTSFVNPSTQENPSAKQLSSYIVDNDVDPLTESTYVQNGFTWVKYYYENLDQKYLDFLQGLQETFSTPSGQKQIVIQKINSKYLNETSYVIITSPAGQESFSPDRNSAVSSFCRLLTITPIECTFRNINVTS